MRVAISLAIVGGLFLLGLLGGAPGLNWIFGVVIPYLAVLLFFGGLIYRVMSWANVPVPFRIPTTCGQQKSLPWIKQQKFENPHNTLTVIGRMALEILFFRSLLRNTKSKIVGGRRVVYTNDLWLWLGAMAMHWSLLIILIRHVRFFTVPVPYLVAALEKIEAFHNLGATVFQDGKLIQLGSPAFQVTTFVFLGALAYLLLRRLVSPQLRYISLANDYFPLFLLLGIGLSGFWLRHIDRTSIEGVKELAIGLVTFGPTVPDTVAPLFYGHLFLVSVLLVYLPLSKLSHMPGVFLSPTRNLANSTRMKRHVNPWDYPVKIHTYDEYEDELRDKMKAAGIPVEKE